MIRRSKFPAIPALVVLCLIAAADWVGPASAGAPGAAHDPGGPFALTDHMERAVTDRNYRGKFLLVFFGYTFCPDVCPTTLAEVAVALDLLGDDAARLTPLFISIDPDRDTPAAMADYVSLFHPSIVGLTGTPEQIGAVAEAYRVFFETVHDPDIEDTADDPYYTMDHSAFVYLMGPDGGFRTVFGFGTAPELMADKIRRHMFAGT